MFPVRFSTSQHGWDKSLQNTKICRRAAKESSSMKNGPICFLNEAPLRQSCSPLPGSAAGCRAGPEPGHAAHEEPGCPSLSAGWGFLPPVCRGKPSHSAGKQEVLWGFASVLRIGACERILMHLPYLAAKRKRKSPWCLRTNIQGSKKVPGRSSQVCFIPVIWADFLPLENQLCRRMPARSPHVY